MALGTDSALTAIIVATAVYNLRKEMRAQAETQAAAVAQLTKAIAVLAAASAKCVGRGRGVSGTRIP